MERLTRKKPDGRYGLVKGKELGTVRNNRTVIDRLGAYEDSGLVPEEAAAIEAALIGRLTAEIKEINGVPIKRLNELAQAEKDGRLAVLPCKVGDTVYVIPSKANYALNILNRHPENNRVYEQPVREVRFYNNGVFLLITCDGTQAVHSKFFGETWFLTREEAEAALKAQKGGEENA